jgi:hypothetical protein
VADVGIWERATTLPAHHGRSGRDESFRDEIRRQLATCSACGKELAWGASDAVKVRLTRRVGPLGVLKAMISSRVHEGCLDEARRQAAAEHVLLDLGWLTLESDDGDSDDEDDEDDDTEL